MYGNVTLSDVYKISLMSIDKALRNGQATKIIRRDSGRKRLIVRLTRNGSVGSKVGTSWSPCRVSLVNVSKGKSVRVVSVS